MSNKKFRFTKASIDELTIFGYYYDAEVKGLCVKVNHNGSKTFYIYRRVRGDFGFGTKPERVKIGIYPDLTIEQARKRAEEINGEVAKGNNPLTPKRVYEKSPTFGELYRAYLDGHLKKKKKKTYDQMVRCFERWFGDWKNRKAITLTRQELEKRHAEIGETRGIYAANRAHDLIRAIFNKALQWNLIEGTNPAAHITQFVEKTRERFLREDELERFFFALRTETNLDLKDFIHLSLFTGQRKSNVLAMRWADIDFKGNTWTIPGETTKNGQTLTLALTPAEIEILKRRAASKGNEFVFPGTGKTKHFVEPKNAWKRLLKRADVQDLRIHDLRRSLASYMAITGANVALIKGALNHKDLQTTLNVYARTGKQAEMEARRKAHEKMLELAGDVPPDNVVPFARKKQNVEF